VDARVILARIDGRLIDSVAGATDARGRFAIQNVPAGTYRVFATEDNYLRGEHAAPITIAAATRVDNIAIALTPTAVIAGRVVTDSGEPAPKILVRALTSGVAAEARTNDLGEYRLFGLAPGSYVVSAERSAAPRIERDFYWYGGGLQTLPNLLKAGGFIDRLALLGQTYPAVYYPGTTDRAAARPLDVGPGAQVAGIDVRLVVQAR
jgi:hypothetical protein